MFGTADTNTRQNTRITDVELLERRLPIIIREFSIRRGSGGKGRFNGGDGIVRDWVCRVPLTFSIITERRVLRPYGMHGGDEGANGVNFWAQLQEDGSVKWVQLGPRGLVEMAAGDRCVVHTPSGGGWGLPEAGEEAKTLTQNADGLHSSMPRAAGSYHNFLSTQAAGS